MSTVDFSLKSYAHSLHYLIHTTTCELYAIFLILQTENRLGGVRMPTLGPQPVSGHQPQIQTQVLCLLSPPCLDLTISSQTLKESFFIFSACSVLPRRLCVPSWWKIQVPVGKCLMRRACDSGQSDAIIFLTISSRNKSQERAPRFCFVLF